MSRATAYVFAEAAMTKDAPPDARARIAARGAGAKPGPAGASALQNLRTYKLTRPANVSGWGTFRLEITTAGVIESQEMSGEKQIAGVKPRIDAMKFPELLPPDSKAHLLRSAVISCSVTSSCEVVLVPDGGLQSERQ